MCFVLYTFIGFILCCVVVALWLHYVWSCIILNKIEIDRMWTIIFLFSFYFLFIIFLYFLLFLFYRDCCILHFLNFSIPTKSRGYCSYHNLYYSTITLTHQNPLKHLKETLNPIKILYIFKYKWVEQKLYQNNEYFYK